MEVDNPDSSVLEQDSREAKTDFAINLDILNDYELPQAEGNAVISEVESEGRHKPTKKQKFQDTDVVVNRKTDDVLGDDYREREERRLEQLLFGKLFEKKGSIPNETVTTKDESEDQEDSDSEDDDAEEMSDSEGIVPTDKFSKALGIESSSKKKPVWTDADDETIMLKDVVATYKRGAGRHGSKETSETNYRQILEKNFSAVRGQTGTPKWAQLGDKGKKRKLKHSDSEEDNEEAMDDPILTTAGDFLQSKSTTLTKGILDFKRLKDVNHMTHGEGAVIKAIEFHKRDNVALVAGLPGVVSLFQVDGRNNSKIQTVHFEKFPISCARFSSDGDEFIATSHVQRHINVYNMVSGKVSVIPHDKSIENGNMKLFSVSPDGKILAFQGRFGYIHLMSAKSKEWITSLKMNGQVQALTFSPDGSRLYTHGELGEVYVWDMNTRQCVHRFFDEGCITGTSIAVSPTQQYIACGSSSGVVNIYDTASLENQMNPKPVKVLLNLVTTANSLKFHPSSEMLCMASEVQENAVRLVHFPSLTVFQNFPHTQSKSVHQIKSCDFSPNGGYFALGNNRGAAMLFRLRHYREY